MPSVAKILASMRANPRNIDYADLFRVCEEFFRAARNSEDSHAVFKTS